MARPYRNRASTWFAVFLLFCCACGEGSGDADDGAATLAAVDGCPTDQAVDSFVDDWRERRPAAAIIAPDASLEAALCAQAKIVDRIQEDFGPVVGYKAGLTSAPSQERFGSTEPVRGVLLESMLLPDGAEVPAHFGARPLFEADLLLVVADSGVNAVDAIDAVLPHLSAVIPFVELPDLAVADDQPLNATVLTGINVGARLGVMGRPIPVEQSPEFFQALADMTVTVSDDRGRELAVANGDAVLGHPLNAVLWLMRSGVRLEAGDLVSVGSIGPLLTPESGRSIRVQYAGLPGDPTVSVSFQ